MVSDDIKNINNTKSRHIYEFPDEIQGLLYMADAQSSGKALQKLYDYKKEHGICSEEFIHILAEMYMKNGEEDTADRLIAELKRSSSHAKKEAEKLENIYRTPAVQDNMDWGWSYPEEIIQPYVRKEPKIGRNDPCPCGSGKK